MIPSSHSTVYSMPTLVSQWRQAEQARTAGHRLLLLRRNNSREAVRWQVTGEAKSRVDFFLHFQVGIVGHAPLPPHRH